MTAKPDLKAVAGTDARSARDSALALVDRMTRDLDDAKRMLANWAPGFALAPGVENIATDAAKLAAHVARARALGDISDVA